MPKQEFARELVVDATPAEAWDVMTDIPRLVRWISVLDEAQELEHLARYEAHLMDRLGMFSLRADLAIEVTEHSAPHYLRARAAGEDRQMGSRIAVELELKLREVDSGVLLDVSGVYDVTGRVATLGNSTIRRKADKVIEEFFTNLSAEFA